MRYWLHRRQDLRRPLVLVDRLFDGRFVNRPYGFGGMFDRYPWNFVLPFVYEMFFVFGLPHHL